MAVTFDTLKAFRRLRDAGFDEAKSEAIVSIFAGDIGASLAAGDDLAKVSAALTRDIKDLEQRLTIRVGAMVAGGVAILLTAMGIVTAIILTA